MYTPAPAGSKAVGGLWGRRIEVLSTVALIVALTQAPLVLAGGRVVFKCLASGIAWYLHRIKMLRGHDFGHGSTATVVVILTDLAAAVPIWLGVAIRPLPWLWWWINVVVVLPMIMLELGFGAMLIPTTIVTIVAGLVLEQPEASAAKSNDVINSNTKSTDKTDGVTGQLKPKRLQTKARRSRIEKTAQRVNSHFFMLCVLTVSVPCLRPAGL